MNQTALLVMDVQPSIVARLPDPAAYLAQVQAAVDAAHAHKIPVIQVVVGFRPGYPEVSPNNKSFSTIKTAAAPAMVNPQPSLPLGEHDVVVTKRRVSAFTGSDLEVVLRGQGATHLVLTGIATSGVVLSTLREAADKDYRLTVLADLCADFDPEVHTVLTTKVFPRQAEVTTAAGWIGSL